MEKVRSFIISFFDINIICVLCFACGCVVSLVIMIATMFYQLDPQINNNIILCFIFILFIIGIMNKFITHAIKYHGKNSK